MFSFLLGRHPGVRLVSNVLSVGLTSRETALLLPEEAASLNTPPAAAETSQLRFLVSARYCPSSEEIVEENSPIG